MMTRLILTPGESKVRWGKAKVPVKETVKARLADQSPWLFPYYIYFTFRSGLLRQCPADRGQ